MSAISRRRLLTAGAALIGFGALPTALRAQQLRQISFITPLNYLIGYAPSLNAQAGGHFAKEGLDVTILPGKGSAVAVQQVIAGRALYGRGDPLAMAKAISQGAPIIAFATIEHRSPIVVYSSPKKPIRNVQRHDRQGHRNRGLRQRLRQHPRHDAGDERHEARRRPPRGDWQQPRWLGPDPTGPRRRSYRQHRHHHRAQGARRGHCLLEHQRRAPHARTGLFHPARDCCEGTRLAAEDPARRPKHRLSRSGTQTARRSSRALPSCGRSKAQSRSSSPPRQCGSRSSSGGRTTPPRYSRTTRRAGK